MWSLSPKVLSRLEQRHAHYMAARRPVADADAARALVEAEFNLAWEAAQHGALRISEPAEFEDAEEFAAARSRNWLLLD